MMLCRNHALPSPQHALVHKADDCLALSINTPPPVPNEPPQSFGNSGYDPEEGFHPIPNTIYLPRLPNSTCTLQITVIAVCEGKRAIIVMCYNLSLRFPFGG